jgi:hypothetical protein
LKQYILQGRSRLEITAQLKCLNSSCKWGAGWGPAAARTDPKALKYKKQLFQAASFLFEYLAGF